MQSSSKITKNNSQGIIFVIISCQRVRLGCAEARCSLVTRGIHRHGHATLATEKETLMIGSKRPKHVQDEVVVDENQLFSKGLGPQIPEPDDREPEL